MRIVAGSARGRQFETLAGFETRPTLDRVKESVFGSLQFEIPGSHVLDLFSGSGNLGLEAASRGASLVICNDHSPECAALIRRNAQSLQLDSVVSVMQLDYRAAIERLAVSGVKFDFAFLDAPYASGLAMDAADHLFRRRMIRAGGRVLIEHASADALREIHGVMHICRVRRFGKCAVTEMESDDV